MAQLELFIPEPRARRTDPVTSHEAAEKARQTGLADNHRAAILNVLSAHTPLTAGEIGHTIGLTNVQVCRRLSELEKAGLAVRNSEPPRICRVMNSKQSVWIKSQEVK